MYGLILRGGYKMKDYDYVKNGDRIDLFQVTKKAKKVLNTIPSYHILNYQRCTDSIHKDHFNRFKAGLKWN